MCGPGKGESVVLPEREHIVGYYAHEATNTVWFGSPSGAKQIVATVAERHSAAYIALVLEADRQERVQRALDASNG